jgi:hypothetical protein
MLDDKVRIVDLKQRLLNVASMLVNPDAYDREDALEDLKFVLRELDDMEPGI